VTVLGSEGKAENVLSQSDIVRFLVEKMDDFPAVFDKAASELGTPIYILSGLSPCSEAFSRCRLGSKEELDPH